MTPSKILFFLCISFVAGIAIESFLKIPQVFVWGFLFLGIILIFIRLLRFARNDGIIILGFCLLLFVLGILRIQIAEFNISGDKLSKFNNKGEIVLTGAILNEPVLKSNSQQLKVKIDNFSSVILITASRYPEFNYLDKIKITGKLETPQETNDFSYKNYLMKDGIYSVMAFPKTELLGKEKYNLFSYIYEKILFLKDKIRRSIQDNFLPPQSSILEGTILGDNAAMSDDLKNKLNITGLRHIIAVSGTHVVILSSIIMSLFLAAGFSRGKAFYFAIIFILFYVVMTGLPASGVRAGIMGTLFLLAQKLGRQSMSARIIILAGAVMLIFNPMLLFYDVGFQLSFLAVIGLIYLGPVFKIIFKNEIISATLSAQVFTLPILIYSFGNISFVSPITNLLVLPIVYWLMIFGFLSAFLGIFWPILGWIFFVPCYFILKYFLFIIDFFSKPWAIKTFENVHWAWVFVLYAVIFCVTHFIKRKFYDKMKII